MFGVSSLKVLFLQSKLIIYISSGIGFCFHAKCYQKPAGNTRIKQKIAFDLFGRRYKKTQWKRKRFVCINMQIYLINMHYRSIMPLYPDESSKQSDRGNEK